MRFRTFFKVGEKIYGRCFMLYPLKYYTYSRSFLSYFSGHFLSGSPKNSARCKKKDAESVLTLKLQQP